MSTTPSLEDVAAVSLAESTESHSDMVVAVTVILTAMSTIIFGLRFYTRAYLLKTIGAEDWTMLSAQILAIVTGTATALEARAGLGRHIETLTPESIRESLVCLYVAILTYNMGLNIVKISLLLQYRRIFPSATLQRICLWSLAFVGVWGTGQQIILSISCIPLAALEPSAAGWCLNTLTVWEFTSIISLLTDFAILLIPLPCVWGLSLPVRQKVILLFVLGLGFFVCVISIIRVPTLRAAASADDPTFDNIGAALWTVAEYNAAIICSSLPILRPLFFKVSGHLSSHRDTVPSGVTADDSAIYKMRDMKSVKTSRAVSQITPQDSLEDLVNGRRL